MFTPQVNCRSSHCKAVADWLFVRSFSRKGKRDGLESEGLEYTMLLPEVILRAFVSYIGKLFARSQASLRPSNGINCVAAFSPC